MLKKARVVHYNFQRGFGFLECLGYSGADDPAPRHIYFHSSSFALPSVNQAATTVSFRYGQAPVRTPQPGLILAYKPDCQNQQRAYTVCHPHAYLAAYARLYAAAPVASKRRRFFLDSWFCADLCRHKQPGVEASLQYLQTRLQTLQRTPSTTPACQKRLALVIELFHQTLCALYTNQDWATAGLELLRYGLLRYDNLLAASEAPLPDELLIRVPVEQRAAWHTLATTLEPQPSGRL